MCLKVAPPHEERKEIFHWCVRHGQFQIGSLARQDFGRMVDGESGKERVKIAEIFDSSRLVMNDMGLCLRFHTDTYYRKRMSVLYLRVRDLIKTPF